MTSRFEEPTDSHAGPRDVPLPGDEALRVQHRGGDAQEAAPRERHRAEGRDGYIYIFIYRERGLASVLRVEHLLRTLANLEFGSERKLLSLAERVQREQTRLKWCTLRLTTCQMGTLEPR